jgi:choline dehydrogenase-like flavoprotein
LAILRKLFSADESRGGTAGCVIARRLAERPDISVLLIEAGKPKTDVPASAIPAAVSQILGTDADWNIQSEPCAELNDRQLHLGRGKFVGGSSGCNGTLCIRGVPQDYDDWEMDGWSGSDMFSYMRKAESFQNKDWFEANHSEHGIDGPLTTAPHDPAPISSRVLESFQSKGLPLDSDMFSTGKTAQGCGHAVRTIHGGVRTTSFDYLGDDRKSNIDILTGRYVDTILLEQRGADLVAAGIQTRDASGRDMRIAAKKEVVVTSGAYGSPAVLLRSGIGPRAELEELGITAKVDLPGVGKNLMDHLVRRSSP